MAEAMNGVFCFRLVLFLLDDWFSWDPDQRAMTIRFPPANDDRYVACFFIQLLFFARDGSSAYGSRTAETSRRCSCVLPPPGGFAAALFSFL